ncbi:MAG TPA: phosphatase PAP2 family protein [Ktedonobacteraceae bacterium]|nr:phosphatase PAP2 family protein [Ktedonobacteraceae bacterium]
MALRSPVKYVWKAFQDGIDALENLASSQKSWTPSPDFERGLTIFSATQVALFVPLMLWVSRHKVDAMDVKITRAVQKARSPLLLQGARALSDLDWPKFLTVAVFPLSFLLWKLRLQLEAVILLGMFLTSEVMKSIIKHTVNRPRPGPPPVQRWKSARGPGFPSGNVIGSITIWGWLFVLGLIYWRDKPVWQKALLAIPLLLIALDGPARIYLGDHWTSDVIGGYLFGNGWLALWFRIYLLLRGKRVLNFSR